MKLYDFRGTPFPVNYIEPNENDIPIVTIDGELPASKNDEEANVTITYKRLSSEFTDYATIKIQGNSSALYYPKKNYTIKLFSDSGRSKKQKRVFRDWKSANKFVLKANWVDHSHARNIVNARLWSQIVKSRNDFDSLPTKLRNSKHLAIDGFPIKVFANGIYLGLYTWNVPKSALYDLDDDIDTNAFMYGDMANYTGSILFRASDDSAGRWSDETHDTKPAVISDGWDRVLDFVFTSSDSDFVSDFTDYFDKQSVIDQYIFIYSGCIVDNLAKNQVFFTYDALKWYGGMYDMDGTWGLPPFPPLKSTWYDYDTAFQSDYTVVTDGDGNTNLLYERVGILFASDIVSRYQYLRSTILSESNICAEFNRFMGAIPPYLYAEDYASTTGNGNFTDIPFKTYDHERQIRKFVEDRMAYVDSVILS